MKAALVLFLIGPAPTDGKINSVRAIRASLPQRQAAKG
jgi:hypothetical protein